ncbi:outer membrane beta-barrel protein [Vibrio comitans]|uniref:Outer membrane protein n=1 Tax=Vibrio comitans NBRC 102076 TaxID=1219078 RepID=A0A4Y3IID4_9VIBR|nr:outer membrane beta-barrel protein [Vibrio comitans]GEA59177.1 outer membrane protein [Vibrio comitans NBRC 102076]
MNKLRFFSLIPATLLSLSAAAAGNNSFFLGVGDVGFSPDGDSTDSFSSPSFIIGGGQSFNEHLSMEGFFRYSEASDDAKTYEINYYELGLSLLLSTGELGDTPLEIFGRTSAIATNIQGHDTSSGSREDIGDTTGGVFTVGAGLQWNINVDYWLRAEYIYGYANSGVGNYDEDYDGLQISLGLDF